MTCHKLFSAAGAAGLRWQSVPFLLHFFICQTFAAVTNETNQLNSLIHWPSTATSGPFSHFNLIGGSN
jgi:hypothetical protein